MTREESAKRRGAAKTTDDAYSEGYAAKYHDLLDKSNPYELGSDLHDAFEDGYAEAVIFSC